LPIVAQLAASMLLLQPAAAPAACTVDDQAMMALGIRAFDQDLEGGWRAVANRQGCRDEAADLIRRYRDNLQDRMRLLYWHEGQLRAGLGETEAAIALFDQARRKDADEYGWNHYVDASIAFLRRDRAALEAARARLAKAKVVDTSGIPNLRAIPGPPRPMNLHVVDAFIRCFDRPYDEAYGGKACWEPATR
jgi:hypothetical protein